MATGTHDEARIPERRPNPWEVFRYRDFRLLWGGLVFSGLGFWMQFTSLTYLVGVVLANSQTQGAMNLAILGAARSVPVVLLTPIAGYVADRYPRRRTLFITNAIRALLGLALALVSRERAPWVFGVAVVIATLFSCAQSFDSPARQSWVSFLVPRPLLSNAIGVNSLASNMPLMIGPAFAGLLIGTVGVYASFLVQAVTQWVVVLAIVLMRPAPLTDVSREPMIAQIKSGLQFIFSHAVLRWIVLMLLVSCLFVRPYNWLLAAFAGHVLHVTPAQYGTMLAVGGIGTVCGALTTAIYNTENRARLWFFSGIVTGTCLLFLGYVHNLWAVIGILTIMGWGTMAFNSSSNVLIQILSPDDMRGRTMSLYSALLIGVVPAGTLIMGAFGSAFGLPLSYATGGAIALVIGVWVWVKHPALREA